MAIGAAIAALGGFFILLAIAQGIAMALSWPPWAGYAIIGVLLGIGGFAALLAGRRRSRAIATLPRTAQTVKETSEWMKYERPHELETAIGRTRRTLDRDLDRLGRRFDVLKDDAAAQAQWWAGIAAVVTGAVGALMLWPRRQRRVRRRVFDKPLSSGACMPTSTRQIAWQYDLDTHSRAR